MLRTILVAVPAFMRVEPVITSGPTRGTIFTSASTSRAEEGLHVKKIAPAPMRRASASAPRT